MAIDDLNAIVAQKIDVSPEVMILRVVPDGWDLSDFIPGQFTILGLPGKAERISYADKEEKELDSDKLIKRPYSVASSSVAKEFIEFYIALSRSGTLTPRLFNLNVGDRIWLSNEFRGMFTLSQVPEDKNIILIGTGTGISPYMSIIRTQVTKGLKNKLAVVHCARHSWDLGYRSELYTLERISEEFNYIPIISLPEEEPVSWSGDIGFINELWPKGIIKKYWGFNPTPDNTHVFLCGHPLMIKGMLEVLGKENFKESNKANLGEIHLERFF